MGVLGCGGSVIAVFFAIIAAFPLLGWLNWLTTLPAALLAIIFSGIGIVANQQRSIAVIGLIAGIFVFFWAMFRLSLGGGIF
ncbi:MAG: hypothetical protein EXR50_03710 [Dehalococcoidia bacterium]|nr:hypothetical protein [Dehalococcoidia bacterium]